MRTLVPTAWLLPEAGNTLAYIDRSAGQGDVYGYQLAANPPVTPQTVRTDPSADVFWLLASLARPQIAPPRPIVAVFALGYLGFAVSSFRFFFLPCVIAEVLIIMCLVLAVLTAKQEPIAYASSAFRPPQE